jgi:GT2 family glycosyltransferase/2-polyprenyl-3-methyl-5-hydroxy-6-metoxy-1,4-benzoquinol methylase
MRRSSGQKRREEIIDPNSDNNADAFQIQFIGFGKKVLGVGYAIGSVRVLKQRGCRVTAIVTDKRMARIVRRYCDRLIVGDIERLDLRRLLGSERFDVVLLGGILQRLRDPLVVLKNLRKLVAGSGFVVASVTNIAHGSVRLSLVKGRFEYQETGVLDSTHLRFFTRASTQGLFRRAGYRVLGLRTTMKDPLESEIRLSREDFADGVLPQILADPDSYVYQFVIKAVPLTGRSAANAGHYPTLESERRQAPVPASPLGVLLALYGRRPDLQRAFPEVASGDHQNLVKWATRVVTGKSEDPSYQTLMMHASWLTLVKIEEYAARFKEKDSEVERLRADLDMTAATLGHIENSPGWRLIGRYRTLANTYLPFGTKRRVLFEWVVRQVLGPIVRPRPSRAYRPEQLNLLPAKGMEVDDGTPFGKWLGKTRLLMATNPRHLAPARSACIDIVIPIHNALGSLQECLRSIREHTRSPYRIVLVDDASSDPRVAEFLAKLQRKDDLVILTNSENMGFVRSANRGFALSSNDVVLLNSDTIVTNNWLDKLHMCAYSSDAIGTVTPFSNNATLCSVPKPWQRNEVPRGFTVDTFGTLIENVSQKEYPPIPTAVGFCVYIKRRLLESIGDFDSNAFSPGYGEENDFCMRAFNKGFLSVLDDSTFVYHKGEMSFGASASSIRDSHLRTLYKRYPDYPVVVAEFAARNPLRVIQAQIGDALAEAYETSMAKVLHVIHLPPETEASGGTGKHCRMLYNNLDDFLSYVAYPQDSTLVLDDHTQVGRRSSSHSSGPRAEGLIEDAQTQYAFSKLLKELKLDIVHFQHLLGMPLSLVKTAKDEAASVVVTCHDGYLVCRDYRLLEMGQRYCDGCTDMSRCDKCLAFQFDLKPGFQERWRETCRSVLSLADRIVVPSEFMKQLFSRVLSIDERRFTVIEHALPTRLAVSAHHPTGERGATRVGFVGAVSDRAKGLEVVLGLLSQNEYDDVEWHFFGERSDIRGHLRNRGLRPRGSLIFHGYYHEGKLSSLLSDHDIDLVVIPSIYGEPYSYVLTEVWQAGIPVIAADFGAIGERVRKNGGGWLYPPGSEPASILSILEKLRKDRKEYDTKFLEAKSVKSKSFLEYVNEYRVLYRGLVARNLQQFDLSDHMRFPASSEPSSP